MTNRRTTSGEQIPKLYREIQRSLAIMMQSENLINELYATYRDKHGDGVEAVMAAERDGRFTVADARMRGHTARLQALCLTYQVEVDYHRNYAT
jgi:hypothetical protein